LCAIGFFDLQTRKLTWGAALEILKR